MSTSRDDNLYYPCQCHMPNHFVFLYVEKPIAYDDEFIDGIDDHIYIGINGNGIHAWRDRIAVAWDILRHGRHAYDEVVLSNPDAVTFAHNLMSIIAKKQSNRNKALERREELRKSIITDQERG